jgi:hypothetical protein
MNKKTDWSDNMFDDLFISVAFLVSFLIVFWLVMINQIIFHLGLTSFVGVVFLIISGSVCLISQFKNTQHYKSQKNNKPIIKTLLVVINVLSFILIIFCSKTFSDKVEILRKAEKSIIKNETVIYPIQELTVEDTYNSSTSRTVKVTYVDKNNKSQTVTIEGVEGSLLDSFSEEKPKLEIVKKYISKENIEKYQVEKFDVQLINKTTYKIIRHQLFDK